LTTTAVDTVPRSLSDIQAPVRAQLARVTGEMARIVSQDMPLLDQITGHLMGMRGKLFRPTIVLLASETAGRSEERATTLAATVELIHLATLVHDDAIDHSVLRRGMPTLNALFSHQISVIMGDFLYSTTLSELVAIGDIEVLRALTRASTDMTLGEMRQLSVTDSLSFSEEDYYALIKSKTASLMSAAAEIGALCGAREHRSNLLAFGEALGMVFQIADDLIDYTEAQETTGKPTGLDLREHKVTLPLIAAMRTMPSSDRKRVDALFANSEPTDGMVSDVLAIVAENGGLDYARVKGEYFAEQARKALLDLPDTVARRSLMDSITYVMERHS
jgi:octaprenyl-diphosphate synthase